MKESDLKHVELEEKNPFSIQLEFIVRKLILIMAHFFHFVNLKKKENWNENSVSSFPRF